MPTVVVNTNQNLSGVTYSSGDTIDIQDGAILTINSTPSVTPGTIQVSQHGQLHILNSGAGLLALTLANPDSDIVIQKNGRLLVSGEMLTIHTGTGGASQTINLSSYSVLSIPTYIEVETGNTTNVWELWPVIPTAIGSTLGYVYFLSTSNFGNQEVGKVVFWDPTTKILSCGNGTNGTVFPNGARVRMPNILIRTTQYSTTLNGAITSGATSITLTSAANFPTSGEAMINNERIAWTGKTSNTLTGCTRGQRGTTAAAANNGDPVAYIPTRTNGSLFNVDPGGRVEITNAMCGASWYVFFSYVQDLQINRFGCVAQMYVPSGSGVSLVQNLAVQYDYQFNGNSSLLWENNYAVTTFNNIMAVMNSTGTTAVIAAIQLDNVKRIAAIDKMKGNVIVRGVATQKSIFITGSSMHTRDALAQNITGIGARIELLNLDHWHFKTVNHSDNNTGVVSGSTATNVVLVTACVDIVFEGVRLLSGGAAVATSVYNVANSSGRIIFHDCIYDGQSNTTRLTGNLLGSDITIANATITNHTGQNNDANSFLGKGYIFRNIRTVAPTSGSTDAYYFKHASFAEMLTRPGITVRNGMRDIHPYFLLLDYNYLSNNQGTLWIGPFAQQNLLSFYTFSGTGYFDDAGSIFLPTNGDYVIVNNIRPIRGISNFVSGTPTVTGTNTGNLSLQFRVSRYGRNTWTAWQAMTDVNLYNSLITLQQYSPQSGFDMQVKITTDTTSQSTKITSVACQVVINQSVIWEVGEVPITFKGVLPGSTVQITNMTDTNNPVIEYTGTVNTSTWVYNSPYNFNGTKKTMLVHLEKDSYAPFNLIMEHGDWDETVWVYQPTCCVVRGDYSASKNCC